MSTPKGFSSEQKFIDSARGVQANFSTVQPISEHRYGLDVVSNGYFTAKSISVAIDGVIRDSETSTVVGLQIAAHGAVKGDLIQFLTGDSANRYVRVSKVIDANNFYISEFISDSQPVATDTVAILSPVFPRVDASGEFLVSGISGKTLVDSIDPALHVGGSGFMSVAANNIPGNAANGLRLVESLSAPVSKVQVIEDIGELISLFSDLACTTLICSLPLAGGEVEVKIPAGTSIYIRKAKDNVAINTDTYIAINFLG